MAVSGTPSTSERSTPETSLFRPGLEGIPATQSAICDIDGQRGHLTYRGYDAASLAANSTFLETAYLLIWGQLPSADKLREFEQEVQMHRRVSFRIRDMMKSFPSQGHPMDALQASAASLGLFYSRRALDNPEYIYSAVIRLLAKIPTMVAAFQLIRKGQDPIQPRDDLPYAANFLYMLTEREPDPLAARIFDACLILHAEHSLNASTFSARVTASTLTDPYAVVASAVGTLAGPLHGGANEDVLTMLEEIGSEDRVELWLDRAIANRQKIMGFGHREYKVKDPRAVILQRLAEELFGRAASLAEELGLEPLRSASVGGASDGNFTAGVGVPTLDGLGAVGGGAHAEHEHVLVEAIPGRLALLTALLVDLQRHP